MPLSAGTVVPYTQAERVCSLLFDSYAHGLIDESTFLRQHAQLVWHDASGERWTLGSRSRTWFRWDGDKWTSEWPPATLRFTPPVFEKEVKPEAPAAIAPDRAERRKLALTPLLLVVILVAITGAGFLVKTLVPGDAGAARAGATSTQRDSSARAGKKLPAGSADDSPPPPAPNQQSTPFEVAGNYNVLIGDHKGKNCSSVTDLSEFIVSHSDVQILITLSEHAIPGTVHDDRTFDAAASYGVKKMSLTGTFKQADSGDVSINNGVLLATDGTKGSCTIHFTAAKQ